MKQLAAIYFMSAYKNFEEAKLYSQLLSSYEKSTQILSQSISASVSQWKCKDCSSSCAFPFPSMKDLGFAEPLRLSIDKKETLCFSCHIL